MDKAKPFEISKMAVWRAYERVKANRGSAGVDGQSLDDFDKDLKGNLYKIWNRMSSGTYFPPPVRTVSIPKSDGGKRKLGIPTIADRVAQTVVKMALEPIVDPIFHEDSYGYRPGKSAHQAIAKAQERCRVNPWVIDLDIKGFFDTIDHELLMRAVRHHTSCKWKNLYIERWLKAGVIEEDGQFCSKVLGTPQGGVVSPLLANLFLHYVFDVWVVRTFPWAKFERYADDIVIHCRYLADARKLMSEIKKRFKECGLTLHPDKTKLVFCQNRLERNKLGYHKSFDFLGFTFRQRTLRNRQGVLFDGFAPAISKTALKKISRQIRWWQVGRASDLSIQQVSELYNPAMRGWVNYYSRFYPSAMEPIQRQWYNTLTKWAMRKYKRFGRHRTPAGRWINDIKSRDPQLFAIWRLCSGSPIAN